MELLAVNVGYYTVKGTVLVIAHRHIVAERKEHTRWCFRKTMIVIADEYLSWQDRLSLGKVSTEVAGVLTYHQKCHPRQRGAGDSSEHHHPAERGPGDSSEHHHAAEGMPAIDYHVPESLPLNKTVQLILRNLCIAQNRKKAMTTAIASHRMTKAIASHLPSQARLAHVLQWAYSTQVEATHLDAKKFRQPEADADLDMDAMVDADAVNLLNRTFTDGDEGTGLRRCISVKPGHWEEGAILCGEGAAQPTPGAGNGVGGEPPPKQDDTALVVLDGTANSSFLSAIFPSFSIQLQPLDEDTDDEAGYTDSDDEMLLHLSDADRYTHSPASGACVKERGGANARTAKCVAVAETEAESGRLGVEVGKRRNADLDLDTGTSASAAAAQEEGGGAPHTDTCLHRERYFPSADPRNRGNARHDDDCLENWHLQGLEELM